MTIQSLACIWMDICSVVAENGLYVDHALLLGSDGQSLKSKWECNKNQKLWRVHLIIGVSHGLQCLIVIGVGCGLSRRQWQRQSPTVARIVIADHVNNDLAYSTRGIACGLAFDTGSFTDGVTHIKDDLSCCNRVSQETHGNSGMLQEEKGSPNLYNLLARICGVP